jgi:methylamine--corrinoid protein Co-methyltransferase
VKMIDFLDVCERAEKGPLMTERDFELEVFIPKLRQVANEYGIQYDSTTPVPADNDAADNLYEAAVDFLARVGVYCQDTNRVIQFTREEIWDAVSTAPGECFVGEGKDTGVFRVRKPDDGKMARCHVNWGTIHSSVEMATNIMAANVAHPEAKGISISSVNTVRGMRVKAGSPLEIYAGIQAVNIAREACRRAGRPGLPFMNLVPATASAVTTIAASAPQFGLRPTDGWIIGVISENKVDYGALNKVAYLLNWGANIGAQAAPSLGGYCGGAAGTAIVNTAYFLMGLLTFKANYHLCFPIHFKHGCCSTRDVLWVVSNSCQAGSRNIPIPVIWLGYMAAGVHTKMYFYEAAAYLLSAVTSGAAAVKMPTPAKGVKVDASTPMETKFGIEMTKAASRLNRQQANELVIKLLEKYEPRIPDAPAGDRYQDCYDVETGKPGESYRRLYGEVKEELGALGIPFD